MAKFRLKTDEFAVKNIVKKERKALKILGFSLFSRVRTNSAKTVGVCDRIFVGVVLTRNGGENG